MLQLSGRWLVVAMVLGVAAFSAQAAPAGLTPGIQKGQGRGDIPVAQVGPGAPVAAPSGAVSARVDQTASEPFPYAYIGAVGEGGERKIVLERDSHLSIVGRGDVLDRAYRIRMIHRDGVEIYFLSSQVRRFIPFSEIAHANGRVDLSGARPVPSVKESSEADSEMNDSAPPPRISLEKLMDLRPPEAAMETTPPSSRDSMVALPPSEKDPQP